MTPQTFDAAAGRLHKWIDPVCLHPRKARELSVDLERVLRFMQRQEQQIAKLKKQAGYQPPAPVARFSTYTGAIVKGPAHEVAQTLAEVAGDGVIDVYRFRSGGVTWRRNGATAPQGAEFVGRYDEGCDWRQVMEDLTA